MDQRDIVLDRPGEPAGPSVADLQFQDFKGHQPEKINVTILRRRYFLAQGTALFKDLNEPLFPPDEVHSSTTNVEMLKRTTISELSLEVQAKGTYLLLRTLEPATQCSAIVTIVEDHTGDGTIFCAYNMITTAKEDCQELFPIGTVFVLKEPIYKVSKVGTNFLRCDSPTDILYVYEWSKFFHLTDSIEWKNPITDCPYPDSQYGKRKTALDWYSLGTQMERQGKVIHAIRFYFKSLVRHKEFSAELRESLVLSLSAAHLKTGDYELAVGIAAEVLTAKPNSSGARFHAGKGLYQLRDYEQSRRQFSRLAIRDPDGAIGQEWLQRCEDRLREQHSGTYDMCAIQLESCKHPKQPLDFANYVGPIEEVNSGDNRRVIATQQLLPGTLLLVIKAVHVVWKDGSKTDEDVSNEMTADIANMVMKNPRTFGALLNQLATRDTDVGRNNPENIFCDPETREEPIAVIAQIRRVIASYRRGTYSVAMENHSLHHFPRDSRRQRELHGPRRDFTGEGVFPLKYAFSHCCLPNTSCEIYNDLMFIRVVQPIDKEQEITFNYLTLEDDPALRRAKCQRRGTQTNCQLCILDKMEAPEVLFEREGLMNFFEKEIKPRINPCDIDWTVITNLKQVLRNVETTYVNSERHKLKLHLSRLNFYLGLAYTLEDRSKTQLAIQPLLAALRIWGFEPFNIQCTVNESNSVAIDQSTFLNPFVIDIVELLIRSYIINGSYAKSKIWVRILMFFEKALRGLDQAAFRWKYASLANLLEKSELLITPGE